MVSSFRRNQQGTVAIIFSLALVPMLVFMGVAVDYTRAADARTKMQAAIDATALAAARMPATMSQADVSANARSFFDGNLAAGHAVAVDSFSVTRDMNTGIVTVSASGHLRTSLLGAVDVSSIEFGATTTAQSGSKNLEVVMALDNTGSMQDNGKIGALIDAAKELVDDLSTNVTGEGQLKIGMVPFATDVRVDPSDTTYSEASWIDLSNAQKTCTWNWWSGYSCQKWTGCIRDRSSPYNTNDTAVTNSATKYPATLSCGSQENLTFVQPLTTDFGALKTQINSMTAGGNTNVTIGAVWGLSLLSQQAPFTEGVAFGDPETEKFLIVLTDGANTSDRYSYCNGGYSVDMTCVATMNTRTLAACTAAKNAGITVYTIGVMLDTTKPDGASADAMLASCATDKSHYLPVTSATQLVPTFLGIAKSIENLRITS